MPRRGPRKGRRHLTLDSWDGWQLRTQRGTPPWKDIAEEHREVPMGGVARGVGFVNAPLTASEVQNFKKELGNLVEDPIGVSNQIDQFLGPNTYTWEELNSILKILFSLEEGRMIRTAGMRIWERENRIGPPGDYKLPVVDPRWNPNREEDRRSMEDYRNLMIRGIKESVPWSSNTKLAFDSMQGKDETPATWLNGLKKNFQLYSSIDPDSPEGQILLKTQFVTKSWPDIRRKLEKMEHWQEKGINELLREALRVYLRREEEKTKVKARIMVAVARESIGVPPGQSLPGKRDSKLERERKEILPPWGTQRRRGEERNCFYCGEKGHLRRNC
ncbi:hypothetical protein DUI87_11243 [Hirundo rustica rustica]|uniref:CCHC-type domain-containing protein n=1 Tax=Hirundo rustica rustica TaxID=333673 RepID=A0A3M0KFW4_HIRRU|nr:hypothetical protein DUI87_11243 [Hirundo rustica rustica]